MHCKSYSHFFSKKFQHICVSLDVNFNESLTNDILSFAQLGPDVQHICVNNANWQNNKIKEKLGESIREKVLLLDNIYIRFGTKLFRQFSVGLKSLLQQGLSEPAFYGDLVYKFRKIYTCNDFSTQFRKIILRYIKFGYNINVIRQTACIMVNLITLNNFASLFGCTPPDRQSTEITTYPTFIILSAINSTSCIIPVRCCRNVIYFFTAKLLYLHLNT